jgi:hypothetical protein
MLIINNYGLQKQHRFIERAYSHTLFQQRRKAQGRFFMPLPSGAWL